MKLLKILYEKRQPFVSVVSKRKQKGEFPDYIRSKLCINHYFYQFVTLVAVKDKI